MDRPFLAENSRERQHLIHLVEKLSDQDLLTPIFGDWTAAAALAHLAFWDQWSLSLLRRWRMEKVSPVSVDTDLLNDTLVPLFLKLPPREAAQLAVASAEQIDRELEQAPDSLIQDIQALGTPRRLNRSLHRKAHLDEIEARLRSPH